MLQTGFQLPISSASAALISKTCSATRANSALKGSISNATYGLTGKLPYFACSGKKYLEEILPKSESFGNANR